MKLILTNEVSGLGSAGDVVEVKDGYGRNYLVPRGLATPWTRGGEKQVEALRKGRAVRELKSLDEAKGIKGQLETKLLRIDAHAGPNGRLFGALTQGDVAQAAADQGLRIDKRRVEFATPIKSVGDHEATVALHPEVKARVKLQIAPS